MRPRIPQKNTAQKVQQQNQALKTLRQQFIDAWKKGDMNAALGVCERALKIAPNVATLHNDRAVTLVLLDRYEEAIAAARKAIDLGVQGFGSPDALAHAYSALGNDEEAARWGRQALELRDTRFAGENASVRAHTPAPLPPPPSPQTRAHNVIAFSLFGNQPKYCETAIYNAQDSARLYPDWVCHFHVDEQVPDHVIRRLEAAGAVIIRPDARPAGIPGTMWRFLSYDTPGLHRILFRDADSLVSERERGAVAEWVQSDCRFHVMRDFGSHTELLLAGMWGCTGGSLPPMAELIARSPAQDTHTGRFTDQYFLREMVWPYARQSLLTHDSIFGFMSARPFPDGARNHLTHVGGNVGTSYFQIHSKEPAGTLLEWSIFHKDDPANAICTYHERARDGEIKIFIPKQMARAVESGDLVIRAKRAEERI